MLRRYHSCRAGARDAAELGECGPAVAGIVDGQRADDEIEGSVGVGQRLPERSLVDPYPFRYLAPGQADHYRTRIEGGDLGSPFQQFAQIKTRAASCVQHMPINDGPERSQHRRPVVVCVVRTVCCMLPEAHAHFVVDIPQVLIHEDTMTHRQRRLSRRALSREAMQAPR